MENKLAYKLQTGLLIIYLAVLPLLYSQNPQAFHNIKLYTMYSVIGGIALVALFFGRHFREKLRLSFKTFKTERRIMTIIVILMFLSLFQNMIMMQLFVKVGYLGTPIFLGAGPNYLSIFFYWGAMLLFLTVVPVWDYVKKDWIKYATIAALVITGLLIAYQVFVNDFVGVGRNYLFGFGNSNYVPDPFAIVGLALVLPFLFSEKIKWHEIAIGAFFFFIVLLSVSRAAYVGIGAAVLFTLLYLIIRKKVNWKRTGLLVGITLGVLIVSYLILGAIGDTGLASDFDSLRRLLSGESDLAGISSLRTELWGATFNRMNSDPIIWFLGNGQSVFMWVVTQEGVNYTFSNLTELQIVAENGARFLILNEGGVETVHAIQNSYMVTNVHNMYIDVLFSGGIFVFVGFMFLLVKQFIYGFKLANADIKNVVILAAMVFIVFKWMFNSLNAVHSPFVLMVFIINSYRYMELKKEAE